MLQLTRSKPNNPDFIHLVKQLDAYLAITDGEEHNFYNQYNKIDQLAHVIVAYENQEPISCGAMKEFNTDTVEIKRMYTIPGYRGIGVAGKVLKGLESWAQELGYQRCVLETGKRQTEALAFYPGRGYKIIPNYGQYALMQNSVCFEKVL